MSYIVVDVEADGPNIFKHSMVCFGAVVVEPKLDLTFYGQTAPISNEYVPEALAVSGFTREQHQGFPQAHVTMRKFETWIKEVSIGKPIFISDNPAFDFQWINAYAHEHLGYNPFGFSARRIGDLYCGMKMDAGKNSEWKKLLRKTKHTHHPVQDCLGNAEALLAMQKMGLRIRF